MQDALQPQQPPQRAPGAEFLEARLRRCAALPPAQRGPDEAAFLESVQLCREVCELLPLTPSGRPALPSMPFQPTTQTVELALTKLWRAMYVCPYHCTPAGGSDPWIPVIAYLQHRTASSDYDLLQTIRWGEDSTEAGGAAGGSSSSRGSRAAAGHSYGSAVQFSSVPASSALRLALLCAALGRVTRPTLGMARLLRAAVAISSDPACAAAMDSRLAELAASQPSHHSPLQLTARQLCCACCACLAGMDTKYPTPPKPSPANQLRLIMRLSAAEQLAELRAMVASGVAGLLQLEPHSPRTLLHAVVNELALQHRVSIQSLERCLKALRTARQQGSSLSQGHASGLALAQLVTLLTLPGGCSLGGRDGNSQGGHSEDGSRETGGVSGSKPSGRGAGAARRQQRRAVAQYQQMQNAAMAAAGPAPCLPAATAEAVLQAFRQSGSLLKGCQQVLPGELVESSGLGQPWECLASHDQAS